MLRLESTEANDVQLEVWAKVWLGVLATILAVSMKSEPGKVGVPMGAEN